jgi:release factor glutamine methyltransferase
MRPSAWRWLAWRIPTTKLHTWLVHAHARLAPVSENPALEAQLLLGHVLQQSRTWVVAHPQAELEPRQQQQLDDLLERLLKREPLPYLLEKAEFYGLTFTVSPCVLIPRPETELLVDEALLWLRDHPTRRRAVDVGAGSGAIGVALAVHCPDLRVAAVERSWAALEIARTNSEQYGVSERVSLVQADLLEGIEGPFDLVGANLPYIPTETLEGLDVLRYEPRLALDGGSDGLRLVERVLADLPRCLAPGGLALFEIEAGQGESALALAQKYAPDARRRILQDLAGNPRLLVVESREEKRTESRE